MWPKKKNEHSEQNVSTATEQPAVLTRGIGESLGDWDLRRRRALAQHPRLTPAEFERVEDKNNYTLDHRHGTYVRTSNHPPVTPPTDEQRVEALIGRIDIGMTAEQVSVVRTCLRAEFADLRARA